MASLYNVSIHSEINEFPTEKRYSSDIKIGELKEKLELITGANHKTMNIELYIEDKLLGTLDNNDKKLADYVGQLSQPDLGLKLVVKDENLEDPLSGEVPKYTLSDEKYISRPNNVRNFIKNLRRKDDQNEQQAS